MGRGGGWGWRCTTRLLLHPLAFTTRPFPPRLRASGSLNSWKGRWEGRLGGLGPEVEGRWPGEQTPGSQRGQELGARTTAVPPLPATVARVLKPVASAGTCGGGGAVRETRVRGSAGPRVRGSHCFGDQRQFEYFAAAGRRFRQVT